MKLRSMCATVFVLALATLLTAPAWAEAPPVSPELDLEETQPVECSEAVAPLEAQLAEHEQAPMTLETFLEQLEAQEAASFSICEEEDDTCPLGCVCIKRFGAVECLCL